MIKFYRKMKSIFEGSSSSPSPELQAPIPSFPPIPFFAIIMILHSFSIHPDENREQYAGISKLISEERFSEAESRLKNLMEQNGDPVLGQMQTELWMQQGDSEFRKRNFRKALSYYEISASKWLLNPLLQDKIQKTKKEMGDSAYSGADIGNGGAVHSNSVSSAGQGINVFLLDKKLAKELRDRIALGTAKENSSVQISEKLLYAVLFSLFIMIGLNLYMLYYIRKTGRMFYHTK